MLRESVAVEKKQQPLAVMKFEDIYDLKSLDIMKREWKCDYEEIKSTIYVWLIVLYGNVSSQAEKISDSINVCFFFTAFFFLYKKNKKYWIRFTISWDLLDQCLVCFPFWTSSTPDVLNNLHWNGNNKNSPGFSDSSLM